MDDINFWHSCLTRF